MDADTIPAIKGLIEHTLIDWEGRLAAEVFLAGCNFRCPFCHARHLVLNRDELESIPLAAVDGCLSRNAGWIEGVVISGGEPTLAPGLPRLIEHFRTRGLAVKLDTNGSHPEVLARLLAEGRLSAVAMDVKAPLDERYHAAAGVTVNLDAIRESIELLIRSNIEYEFRTTVCPVFHDAAAIEGVALAVRGARRYVLQRFRPLNCLDPALTAVQPYNGEQMRRLAKVAARYVHSCAVRGDAESERTTGVPGRQR